MKRLLAWLFVLVLLSLACMETARPTPYPLPDMTVAPSPEVSSTLAMADSEIPTGAVFLVVTPTPQCAKVTAIQALHIRTDHDANAPIVQHWLLNGQVVRVSGSYPGWRFVSDGSWTGWAKVDYLESAGCNSTDLYEFNNSPHNP
jgi:hypothetical protein